jgi:Na+-driven multidrug efflux pump
VITVVVSGRIEKEEKSNSGESWQSLLSYRLPEAASIFFLIVFPIIFDLCLIASLKGDAAYQTLSFSTNIIHTLIKVSEGISVASITLVGHYNGAGRRKQAGNSFFAVLVASILIGIIEALLIAVGVFYYFSWIGCPQAQLLQAIHYDIAFHAIGKNVKFASRA